MEYNVGDKVRIAMGISNEKIDLFNAKECVVGIIHSVVADSYFVEVGDEILFVPGLAILSKVPNFTKEDLKPGMVVKLRSGEFKMVAHSNDGLVIINKNNYIRLCGYTDNLLCFEDNKDIDIMKVYDYKNAYQDAFNITVEGRKLLWERESHKKMTVAEVKKIVEDSIGEQIEVVDRVLNDKIVIKGTEFTDIDKAISYLKKLKTLKQFKTQNYQHKYKVGDKFFFEELSVIEKPFGSGTCARYVKTPLYNVVGEIKRLLPENDKYSIEINGYEVEETGILLFDNYILDNYGKKINC